MATPSITYRAGTLTYTRPKLAMLFFWLLWGDYLFYPDGDGGAEHPAA